MNTTTYDDETGAFELDFGALWRMVKRRFWLFMIPVVVLGSMSVVVAKLLPPVYQSTGLIAIEQPNVPPDLIETTVTSPAVERIELIKQRFLATENLVQLIREHDLYPWLRDLKPLTQIAQEMRGDISINVRQAESGRNTYIVAFTAAYQYRQPDKAKVIADGLVSWYLSENARTRQERAQETESFLQQETAAAEQEVEQLEERIAEWKSTHTGRLPENQQLLEGQLEELQRARRDTVFRLESLQSERASLEARLNSLRGASSGSGQSDAARLRALLTDLEAQAVALSTTVTDRHPDLIRVRRQIAEIEGKLAALPSSGGTGGATGLDLVQQRQEIEFRIEALDRSIATAERSIQAAEQDIVAIRAKLQDIAAISDQYQALLREHANAAEDFNLLRRKLLEAEMGASLELNQKAERFTLLDPPQRPIDPEGIPKILIALGGIIASAGLGMGAMVGAEFLDNRLRSSKKVERLFGEAPLVLIPEISTRRELIRRWVLRALIGLAIASILAGGTWYVHTYVRPLDVLYIILEREIESRINALGI
jgi:polysaccharide chain length determinant protein (PEP-CTERM system associated)